MTCNEKSSAWVVFSGQTDMPILRLFKKGYRHCYVLLNDKTSWITIDPMASMLSVHIAHVPPQFDLPLWLKDRGLKVVETTITPHTNAAPIALFTCVEVVKRVLGIRKGLIITPWQLYKYLTHQSSSHDQHSTQGE